MIESASSIQEHCDCCARALVGHETAYTSISQSRYFTPCSELRANLQSGDVAFKIQGSSLLCQLYFCRSEPWPAEQWICGELEVRCKHRHGTTSSKVWNAFCPLHLSTRPGTTSVVRLAASLLRFCGFYNSGVAVTRQLDSSLHGSWTSSRGFTPHILPESKAHDSSLMAPEAQARRRMKV